MCRRPYRQGLQEFGCGQCQVCRINRRRLWTHRLMLESRVHEFSSFVTLTYDDAYVPPDGSLRPRDVQLFLKRLREGLSPRVVRYFLVGEYGDHTFRPHYHAALFGVSHLEGPYLAQKWGLGFVQAGSLTWESAAYVAGYVTKKMTAPDDPRLGGKHPEFARMSLRPGIGALAVPAVSEELLDRFGSLAVAREGDVPRSLMHGRKAMPLGRYLRRKLREACGFETTGGQALPAIRQAEELRALCITEGGTEKALAKRRSVEEARMLQVEGRARIFSKKGSL